MSTNHYPEVRKAALALDRNDTKSTWALADAVLACVPDTGLGGDRTSEQRGPGAPLVNDRLRDLAARLTTDGITTPNDDPYSWNRLADLRKIAMAWPKKERHDGVAVRTHIAAGARDSVGRQALARLVWVADGIGRGDVPEGVKPEAWKAAVDRVKARTSGMKVNSNDLRIALGKPEETGHAKKAAKKPTPEQIAEAIKNDPEAAKAAQTAVMEVSAAGARKMAAERGIPIRRELMDAGLEDEALIAAGDECNTALWHLMGSIGLVERAVRQHPNLWTMLPALMEHLDHDVAKLSMIRDIAKGVTDADLDALLTLD